MQIARVEASYLVDVPITPLPLIKEPSRYSLVIVEVATDVAVPILLLTGPLFSA